MRRYGSALKVSRVKRRVDKMNVVMPTCLWDGCSFTLYSFLLFLFLQGFQTKRRIFITVQKKKNKLNCAASEDFQDSNDIFL